MKNVKNNPRQVAVLISMSVLLFFTSCATTMSVTELNGEKIKERRYFETVKNPSLKYYLENKIGLQDVHMKQSQGFECPNTDEIFTVTDTEGNDHKVTKDELGLHVTYVKVSYVENGKIKRKMLMVMTKLSKLDFIYVTHINGVEVK